MSKFDRNCNVNDEIVENITASCEVDDNGKIKVSHIREDGTEMSFTRSKKAGEGSFGKGHKFTKDVKLIHRVVERNAIKSHPSQSDEEAVIGIGSISFISEE